MHDGWLCQETLKTGVIPIDGIDSVQCKHSLKISFRSVPFRSIPFWYVLCSVLCPVLCSVLCSVVFCCFVVSC